MTTRSESTKRMVRLAMLGALAVVLMYFVRFPLLATAKYLEYTPADVPILVASFLYGPWYGVAVVFIVSVIQGLTVSAASGVIGMLMNFLTSSVLCIVAGLIYKHKRTIKNAVLGLVLGGVATILIALPLNVLLTPIYAPYLDMQAVAAMLVPIILPFNALKILINGAATFLIYKPVSRLFSRQGTKRKEKRLETQDIDIDLQG